MKKILTIAIIATLIVGCSKEDPTSEFTQPPTEKPAPGDGSESVAAPLNDDIKTYFSLSPSDYVYKAVKSVTETKGEKTVNGKKIDITQSSIEEKNEESGTLKFKVTGKINGKEFTQSYSFDGFAKKPGSFFMASRGYARWKDGIKKPETSDFAFDELYRLKQTDKFTAKYLSQWAEFCSSGQDGSDFYIYSEEDIDNTLISDIQYTNGSITFVITYKGIRGSDSYKDRPSLRFDKNEYYKQLVSLNLENTKQYYMQGFYENLESFYGNAITISDDKLFVAELVPHSKSCDKSGNTIRCSLSLSTYNDNNPLAQFEFDFSGFKPLSDLKQEWFAATKSDLNDYMSARLSKVPDGDITELLTNRYPVSAWIKMTQMAVRRGSGALLLYCTKSTLNNIDVDTWVPESRRVIHSDIFLADPHFEVISAKKTGNRVIINLAMTNVNEVSLEGVITPIEVLL